MSTTPANTSQISSAEEKQRGFYAESAQEYDKLHVHEDDEHMFALSILCGAIQHFGWKTVLDVGSGTGRAVLFLKEQFPDLKIVGVEPVEELRKIGHQKGLTKDELMAGDAKKLDFHDEEFDLVCAFGVMHHLPSPKLAVNEMMRVSRSGIFISDSNRFGQGNKLSARLKWLLWKLHLWPLFNYLKTGGKGYIVSPTDGMIYSYSIIDNYQQIKQKCPRIHIMNTQPSEGVHSIFGTSHLALLGIKGKGAKQSRA